MQDYIERMIEEAVLDHLLEPEDDFDFDSDESLF